MLCIRRYCKTFKLFVLLWKRIATTDILVATEPLITSIHPKGYTRNPSSIVSGLCDETLSGHANLNILDIFNPYLKKFDAPALKLSNVAQFAK